MYKVLLVEDEILVRLGLKNSICWEFFNMNISAEASNGQEALELFYREKPHIVITDLRMPVLNGMSLIDKIREIDKICKIIILTCVEDFEYARMAISYGITDYIPKLSMKCKDIEAVLSRVKTELDLLKLNDESTENINIRAEMKEKLLDRLLHENVDDNEDLYAQISQLQLKINAENIVVCMMNLDIKHKLMLNAQKECRHATNRTILNMLVENLKSIPFSEVSYDKEHQYIIIFSRENSINNNENWDNSLRRTLEHIEDIIKMYISSQVSFGISSISNGFSSLKRLYCEAEIALSERFFQYEGTIHFYSDTLKNTKSKEDICKQIIDPIKKIHTTSKLLSSVTPSPEKMVLTFFNDYTINSENVRKLFYKLVNLPIERVTFTNEDYDAIKYSCMNDIFKCDTLKDMINTFISYMSRVEEIGKITNGYSREIMSILTYINNNYMNNISLSDEAKKVNLSLSYLCSLFKKEVGMSFTDYIMMFRINKAKELLVSTYLRLYEIAENVGIPDYSYFSRTFKRLTGMGPQNYREQWGTIELGDDTFEDT